MANAELYAVTPVAASGSVLAGSAATLQMYAVTPVAAAPVASGTRAELYTVASVATTQVSVAGKRTGWVRADGATRSVRWGQVLTDGTASYFDGL